MSIVYKPESEEVEVKTGVDAELEQAAGTSEDSFVVPDKFKEKTTEEVVQSYIELEKRLGEQANEIGTLRQFTDSYIQRELDKPTDEVKEDNKITTDDILDDPNTAIEQTIASNPRIKALEEKIAEGERKVAQSTFEDKHPDFMEHVVDDGFKEWVSKSKVRSDMFNRANNYDFDSADELLSNWKERQELIRGTTKVTEATQKRDKDLKDASTESSSTGAKAEKTFSRSELINKRINDPSWYEAHQDEIMKAYQSGNIRP